MSLATRCTHCGTIFRVVQDQLKVSEGWVRCGRCNEVFNALPTLFDLDTEAPPPRQTPTPPEPPAPVERPHRQEWSTTQPTALAPPTPIAAHAPLTAAELATDTLPRPAATDFDLDTSVDLSDAARSPSEPPAPPPASPLASDDSLKLSETPRPWMADPPEDLPTTDEADALESRYLLPSPSARPVRRRDRGPEFADAQFPVDAMLDVDDPWGGAPEASAATTHATPPRAPAAPAPAAVPAPMAAATPLVEAAASALRQLSKAPLRSPAAEDAPASLLRTSDDGLDSPSTQPSRFGENFVPEQVVQPPSQRKGRPGTRGRDPALKTPEFVKRANRQAFWRHPATRGVLLLMLTSLTALLALQVVHRFRDWVVAYHPETRPWLQSWCQQVGCTLTPPSRLAALQVDNATLVRTASEGPGHYRLSVSVHNSADIALAWPHVDLTLTDERGTVVARKAFSPRDAQVVQAVQGDPASATLRDVPEAVPQKESTTLQWSLRMPDLSPAGYTAELFYP